MGRPEVHPRRQLGLVVVRLHQGETVVNDIESILPGTQFVSQTEANADLWIRHGNICAAGNPGCEGHQWYYDANRDGYYLSTWTSKLNTGEL